MLHAAAFSPDYVSARARFRSGAIALSCPMEKHSIGQKAPTGEDLTIDVARFGDKAPERVVVVSSGLHGVEGFLGSAVQAALIENELGGWQPPDGCGLLLLHGLNPYGFAWVRRVNEDNVDLNRNFLLPGASFTGSPPRYADLDPLLNPARPPASWDLFLPRALFNIARYGLPALKNAVAGGQYDFPKGLFYGGAGPAVTQQILAESLPAWMANAKRVLHVDLHSGLGAPGTYKLLVDHPWGSPGVAELREIFGADVVEPWEPEQGVSYEIRGGLGTWCKALLPHVSYDVLVAEFGTVNVLQVIAALQAENQAHHWAAPGDPSVARAKSKLMRAFAPPDPGWRDGVVREGIAVVQRAMEALF